VCLVVCVGEIESELHTQMELSITREKIEREKREMIALRERFLKEIELSPLFSSSHDHPSGIRTKDLALYSWIQQKEKEGSDSNKSSSVSVKDCPLISQCFSSLLCVD